MGEPKDAGSEKLALGRRAFPSPGSGQASSGTGNSGGCGG